ncbi:transcription factor bHLH126-like [Mangifera indica]|uniref:transcription factor bHLH126-like n=1 Tax=Mangifera indica TaxID=29780 RepID=UPI001CFBCD2E|nr:transcription factor bHLH126-like [Mangifera indica]
MRKGKQQNILSSAKDSDRCDNINDSEKKILRKEIERKRRQEMSMLNASLRSLLPLESIKGKRSASDHINEAVNYIKNLEKKIQGLSLKRDSLKNSTFPETLEYGNATSSNHLTNSSVTVSPYCGGVEIVINSVLGEEGLLLSRVLEAVLEEGLDITRCVSTQTDDGFFHNIQSEVEDLTRIDLCELQQKLNDVIVSTS